MSSKKFEENLGGALRFIVKNFGKNSLLDSTHVSEMLHELRPNLSKESEWIKEAIDLGVVEILLENNNDNPSRQIALQEARQMMKDKGFSKSQIKLILDSLKYALKWPQNIEKYKYDKASDYIKEDNLNQEEALNNQNKTNPNNQTLNNNSNNQNTEDKNKNSQDSEQDENNSNSTKKVNKFLIPLFILIFIGIIGTALFVNLKSEDVYVSEIIFDIDYKKEESTYVFKKGDFIIMNLVLDSEKAVKIDDDELNYTVDDASICKVSNEFDKCRITGKSVGDTTIHIYYGNKLIKDVNISFEKS